MHGLHCYCMHLLDICCFFGDLPGRVFGSFLNELVILLNFKSSLYMLGNSSFSDVSFVNISHPVCHSLLSTSFWHLLCNPSWLPTYTLRPQLLRTWITSICATVRFVWPCLILWFVSLPGGGPTDGSASEADRSSLNSRLHTVSSQLFSRVVRFAVYQRSNVQMWEGPAAGSCQLSSRLLSLPSLSVPCCIRCFQVFSVSFFLFLGGPHKAYSFLDKFTS